MASPKSSPADAAALHGSEVTRRDFLFVATGAVAAVGAAAAAWPFIHQMNPAADVLALLAAVDERDALAAKLDADGLPVVTTVGDLTARHIGRRVRVNGTVRNIISVAHTRDGSTVLHLQPGSRSDVCLETASVTPCEVLP